MRKGSRLFKRKAAGMMAAVMMIGILPVPITGFADVLEMPPDSYENMEENTMKTQMKTWRQDPMPAMLLHP